MFRMDTSEETYSQNLIIILIVEFVLIIALFAYVLLAKNFATGTIKYIMYFVLIFLIVIGCFLTRDENNTDFDNNLFVIDFIFIPATAIIFISLKLIYELYYAKGQIADVQMGGRRSR